MILYLIRHGEPDYKTDTLTENGKKQAELCSKRLVQSGLDAIFSSPMGRAIETAVPTSQKLGIPIQIEPWAYELGEESNTYFPDGKWKTMSLIPTTFLHGENFEHLSPDESVLKLDHFVDNQFKERYAQLTEGVDSFLKKLGFSRRDDGFYDITNFNESKIALFCHIGMTRVLLSHLFHIPFHLLATTMLGHFTGITIIEFADNQEKIVCPRLVSFGDIGHLYEGNGPINHYFIHKNI